MFNFFKKNKSDINIGSIQFPDYGWQKTEQSNKQITLVNPSGNTVLSLHFFDKKPDLPTINNIDFLRKFYRNSIFGSNGGLIDVCTIPVDGVQTVKTIFKIPQQQFGMAYIGSLTVPFEDFSFVIKVQSIENGISGMRDSIILNRLMESGEVRFEDDAIQNWFEDPFNPDFKEGTLMNKSEQQIYDKEFPEHPISIVRSLLSVLPDEIKFNQKVHLAKPFGKVIHD